jgi:thiaminase
VIAKQLHANKRSKREGNLYWTWIQNYVANDYVTAVKTGAGKWEAESNGDGVDER